MIPAAIGSVATIHVASGWQLSMERKSYCLFVQMQTGDACEELAFPHEAAALADVIWDAMQRQLVERVVIDMAQLDTLTSEMLGQLVLLQRRVKTHGGFLRLCGLSAANQRVLRESRLDRTIACFRNREEAVIGQFRPQLPR